MHTVVFHWHGPEVPSSRQSRHPADVWRQLRNVWWGVCAPSPLRGRLGKGRARVTLVGGGRGATSERCALRRDWKSSGERTSRLRMVRSRLPVVSRWVLQDMHPTRPRWPCMVRTLPPPQPMLTRRSP